ncbi:2-dehydropantoate 2-reductase [Solimonas sp. K1W22B-7]|uniref:2-dehydropantoate 2-reductase n=1 Tax=Solimonas sp. K1W22B-7 TaxID=2303331 RepID=UPI000E33011F|nr:2-dehydropantoate 2-reductase [Solimonas sp. K1W22B-7]AXQ29798.1 2-dehydropantoate 2-reductase [Solimonas sp. K1W22B-7]
MATQAKICIFGAGSIGCYVGGRLAAHGNDVVFIARPRIVEELSASGLHLTDWEGADLRVAAGQLQLATSAQAAADAGLVLVTVKSAATDEVGAELAAVLKPGAVIVSLQNGLHNAEVLRKRLPGRTVLQGMVPFNVLHRGPGAFHHGSEGKLEAEEHPALEPFLGAFEKAGLPLELHAQMLPVLWAKLLLNLNNAVNALSNQPLKAELSQRAYRRCLALAQEELLGLLGSAGVKPAKLTPLPPHWIPKLLGVPDFLFRRLASQMLEIDPLARSSMWEDLQAGRKTEVDYLNGEVVRLAYAQGRHAPVNARLMSLIHQAENGGQREWSGEALLAELRRACQGR